MKHRGYGSHRHGTHRHGAHRPGAHRYGAHRPGAGANAALGAALWGAAAAFVVMSLFVGGLFYLDFCNLGTLLRRSADGLPLWSLLWLPAVCAAIGFAIGPSVASSSIAEAFTDGPDDEPG